MRKCKLVRVPIYDLEYWPETDLILLFSLGHLVPFEYAVNTMLGVRYARPSHRLRPRHDWRRYKSCLRGQVRQRNWSLDLQCRSLCYRSCLLEQDLQ
jgi:hypothetical protein